MEEKLKEFYQSYKEWLDAGAPHEEPYSRRHGLCSALLEWCNTHGLSFHILEDIMINQFSAAGRNITFPFNTDGDYGDDKETSTQHLNPARIAWVEEHAK